MKGIGDELFAEGLEFSKLNAAFLGPYYSKDVIKTIGKTGVNGAKSAFTDLFNFRKYGSMTAASKVGLGLGLAGVALSGYSNYNDATKQGLNTGEAIVATGVNTTIDIAVGGAVAEASMATGAAIGTFLFPGLGTVAGAAVGAGIGILISWLINKSGLIDSVKSNVT